MPLPTQNITLLSSKSYFKVKSLLKLNTFDLSLVIHQIKLGWIQIQILDSMDLKYLLNSKLDLNFSKYEPYPYCTCGDYP